MKAIKFLLFLVCTNLMPITAQNVFFVTEEGAETADAAISWGRASSDLQGVINAADPGDEVWVAAGTYKPTVLAASAGDNKDKAFVLKAGVKVYGGFAGTEDALAQRDWTTNKTILNGILNATDTVRHVVIIAGRTGESYLLDGFTITGGTNANASGANLTVNGISVNAICGGGIAAVSGGSLTLKNNTVTGNTALGKSGSYGGGIYVKVSAGSATISNNIISENQGNRGGGVLTDIAANATLTFSNNTVNGNSGSAWGGGIYITGAGTSFLKNNIISENHLTPGSTVGAGICVSSVAGTTTTISGNIIIGNDTGGNGGGIVVRQGTGTDAIGTYTITNNTIIGNTSATNSGGVYISYALSAQLTNNLIWGNTGNNTGNNEIVKANTTAITINNCLIKDKDNASLVTLAGADNASNNLDGTSVNSGADASLIFVDYANKNYRLKLGSIAINAGKNDAMPDAYDLDGKVRIDAGTVDIGAYEYQSSTGINETKTQAAAIRLYPSLTNGVVYINGAENVLVKVYNLQGILLLQTTDNQFNLSGFTPGIYIAEIEGFKYKVVKN